MTSNLIANRINDLLILAGFTDKHTIEELTDHYLTHIEEEVKRGLNSQQAIRETFQEIANIDITQFRHQKKKRDWKIIVLFFVILFGIIFLFNRSSTNEIQNSLIATPDQDTTKVEENLEPPSGLPLEKSLFDITSDFGLRMHPVLKETTLHSGIDIKAKSGTPVYATADGTIIEASFKEKPGKFIIIKHSDGYSTKYYHLSEINVKAGIEVKKGQEIGKVGNSGMSMKPHLHYEVLKDGVPVNPKDYIKA